MVQRFILGVLLISLPIPSFGTYISCTGKEPTFLCMFDNRCVSESKQCDGNFDCDDKTDEDHCELITCEGDEWFKCKNGDCIASNFICDGEFDCSDKSDEQGDCPLRSTQDHECPSNDFKCKDGLCIPRRWVCDKSNDCMDASDEALELCSGSPASSNTTLKSTNETIGSSTSPPECSEFTCKSGECIMKRWVCDGLKDCIDGSDEGSICEEKTLSQLACETTPGRFYCEGSGECINSSQVCNNRPDCKNAFDEGHFCSEQVSNCTSLGCEHFCARHPTNGPVCQCDSGYKLHGASECVDINECQEFGKCSQNCFNTPGSYKCSCKDGYRHVSGSCAPIEDDPILIFSTKDQVRVKNLNNNRYSLTASHLSHRTIGESAHAVGVSYDPLESRVYWSEFEAEKEKIVSANIYGGDKRNVITSGLSIPEDIAVDHVGRNIYFTDGGQKHVVVCLLSGAFCSVLIKDGIDKPRAIALHHTKGFLFYTEWGSKPMIVRAGMDGSHPTPIITEEIQWANGVAVDVALDRVFWSDAKYSWIESAKLDGSDRQRVLEEHIIHPFSVGVFGDFVYWSDWQDKVIQSCNKFNGKAHKFLIKENKLVPLGIHISHPLIEKFDHNPCMPKKCSHLCLLTPSSGFACRCPDNMVLGADLRTCIKNDDVDEFALVLSDGNTLSIMRPHNLGRIVDQQLNFRGISQISSVTYNPVEHFLYIGSKASRMIYQVDFRKRTAREIATGYPNDLAYDPFADNLYWTDGDTNSIQVKGMSSGASTIIIPDLNHPVALNIIQSKKLLVFSETKGNPSVKVSSLRGTNIHELPNLVPFIKHPMGITVHDDNSKSPVSYIYIMDSYKNHIIQYNFDQREPKVLQSKLASPTSILSVGGRILWTEIHGLTLYWKGKKEVKYKSLESIVTHSHPLLRLAAVLPSKTLPKFDNISAPCRTKNGGCSDLCFSAEFTGGSICTCPEGKIPLPSNVTQCYSECSDSLFHCGNGECIPTRWKCDGISECSNGKDELDCSSERSKCEGSSFQCPKSNECLPQKWVCDGFKDCEDGLDEIDCNAIDCGPQKSLCDDKTLCVLDIWRCDGYPDCRDGSDELRCISVEDSGISNKTIQDNRIQKDVKELLRMKSDFEGIEKTSSSLLDGDDKPLKSNSWFIVPIVVFVFVSLSFLVGFFIFKRKCFSSSKLSDITLRFRNPGFGLDQGLGFRKGGNRFKEMSVLNRESSNFNAYGNPHFDKPDSSAANIYSELDSGDLNSEGTTINMEDNQEGLYPDEDDDIMYNVVSSSSYGRDSDKVTLL